MAILELSDQQVVGLVKQLPPAQKRAALLTLAEDAARGREQRVVYAESRIRQLREQRGHGLLLCIRLLGHVLQGSAGILNPSS